MKRELYESTNYIHYGYSIEDDRHTIFDCTFPKAIWGYLPKGHKWIQLSALSLKNLIFSLVSKSSVEDQQFLQLQHGSFGMPGTDSSMKVYSHLQKPLSSKL